MEITDLEKPKECVTYFTCQRELPFGKNLWVCGNHPLLGAWNPANSLKLTWSAGHRWNGSIGLPTPGKYEYKFIVASAEGPAPSADLVWEEGTNHISVLEKFPFDNQIKAMSFNIRYLNTHDGVNGWEFRKKHVVAAIRKHAADIVGMQEVTVKQQGFLKNELKEYGEVYQPRDGAEGEGSPIYFRKDRWWLEDKGIFWLSDTPDVVASRTFGNGIPRIAMWAKLRRVSTNQPLFVMNTHYDHQVSTIRVKSSALLAKKLFELKGGCANVVLMGDFNSVPEAEEIVMLPKITGLIDTFEKCKEKEKCATFHNWTGQEYAKGEGERIDYIFISPNMVCESFDIDRSSLDMAGKLYPSDHYPLIANLFAD